MSEGLPITQRFLGLGLLILAFILPVSIAGTNMALVLVTAALLARLAGGRPLDWDRAWNPAVCCLGLYCAVAILSSLTGVAPAVSLRNFHKDLHKLWALLLLLLALRAAPVRRLPEALWLGFAFMAAYGIVQSCVSSYQGFVLHGVSQDWLRAHAFLHPVTYGDMLALGFLGGLAWLGAPRSRPAARGGVVFCLALLGAALVLNQTRGAFLGILAGFAALCVAEPAFRRWLKWALPAAVVGLAVFMLLPSHRSLIAALRHPGSAGATASPQLDRFILWDVAWRIFKDHPWLGL